jgi:hypothetical protein
MFRQFAFNFDVDFEALREKRRNGVWKRQGFAARPRRAAQRRGGSEGLTWDIFAHLMLL